MVVSSDIHNKRGVPVSGNELDSSKRAKVDSIPTKVIDGEETLSSSLFPEDQLITRTEIESSKISTQMKLNKIIKTILKLWESTNQSNELLLDTKKSLFPLLVQLRKSTLKENLEISLITIFYHLQHLQFTKAFQSYFELSIGNIAWPIGVINVSIHSRSNQSKLFGGKKEANIMVNDEFRKWITSIKRLITFMQNYSK
ncbi:hypothetical protein WICMUC_002962 [Wickerhamomyces mucosus]|uniref:Pre-mRNA-splicing factor 18 n=1 Tax=Wickerhamomyces mucosus TaxID=1378264 RepID=A0A9P8PMR7_9ASCO|nr:hypothetical protein WICMUC_002962 [Wickerhamomyces mucosus]